METHESLELTIVFLSAYINVPTMYQKTEAGESSKAVINCRKNVYTDMNLD